MRRRNRGGSAARPSGTWDSLPAERRVLAVARTLTSTSRLLDVLPAFDGDPRVQVDFTLNEGSVFSRDAARLLEGLRVGTVPWDAATRTRYDLAISATANGGLHRLKAPVVVMPHGAGHNRLAPAATGGTRDASGLSSAQLTHRGRVVPAVIALSHEEQLARLEAACPAAAGRGVVTGDPCFDRMLASVPRRDGYRDALGVDGDHRLVVFTSTWGTGSLLGRGSELVARWVADLPLDRYRTALVLHPNVWTRHGAVQLRTVLAGALDAGLALIPPEDGWRAALVAADYVVGDHGSVTYYGAALRRPTALAAFADEEIADGSPMWTLGRALPRLSPARDLHEQLSGLAATPLTHDALGERGRALHNLRATLYDLMRLAPPTAPPRVRAVPAPEAERREITAMVADGEAGERGVRLSRYPASTRRDRLADPHLLVCEDEVDRRLLSSASAFAHRTPQHDPQGWAKEVFATWPGARAAAALLDGSRSGVWLRDGRRAVARGADPTVVASVAYLLQTAARPLEGTVRVGLDNGEVLIEFTPPPADF